ncbi:unnamed protein product, partial [Ectocarpus sp. 12 AP-2014]
WTRVTNQGTGWIIPKRNIGGARHRVSRYKKRQRCRRVFRRQRQQPQALRAGVDADADADADGKKQWYGYLKRALGGGAFIYSRGIPPGGFGLRPVRGGAIQGHTDEDADMSAEQETRSDCSFNPNNVQDLPSFATSDMDVVLPAERDASEDASQDASEADASVSPHVDQPRQVHQPTRSDVMTIMNAMELDKTNSRAFFDAVVPRSASKRPLSELLQLARATPKFQHNPLANIDIGHNSIYVVYSPPQSAKTGVSTGLVMGAAVHDKPLVSIIFTQNKMIDIGRFVSSCRHYNADFKKCANALGCSHGSRLVAVKGDVDEFKRAMDAWVEDDEEMPVFLALQNADHVRKAQDVMQHVDKAFKGVRDEFGRINVQIIFDEGDLAKKGQLGGEDSWEFQLKQPLSSAELASSLAYVTATPQALLVSNVLDDKNRDGRKFVFCEVPVSSNYCGFAEALHPPLDFQKHIVRETLTDTRTVKMKKRGRKGKEKTVEAVVRTPFYDYVSESDKPLSAMVYSGSDWESNKVPRKIEASKVAVDYRTTEGFWTMSWSSGEIDLYTASPYIKEAVLLMKKFKKPVVVHSSMEG